MRHKLAAHWAKVDAMSGPSNRPRIGYPLGKGGRYIKNTKLLKIEVHTMCMWSRRMSDKFEAAIRDAASLKEGSRAEATDE